MIVDVEHSPEKTLAVAAKALAAGSVIAMPTETVYGLAADATNEHAVRRIFEVKRRPSFNPLICHCSDMEMASRYALIDPLSKKLAHAFWPGPMTLVLEANPASTLAERTTAGLNTVAIRIPWGFSNALIGRFGRPLAAPSANKSGRVSATTAEHVAREFGNDVGLILDGGPAMIGVESTILRVLDGEIALLRPGGLAVEEVERLTGCQVKRPREGGPIVAPGMLSSHYAPQAQVRLNATHVEANEALIKFAGASVPGEDNCVRTYDLSPAGDLSEVAARLYSTLKQADDEGVVSIAIVPIPNSGIGLALNDRINRAAAPRNLVPE